MSDKPVTNQDTGDSQIAHQPPRQNGTSFNATACYRAILTAFSCATRLGPAPDNNVLNAISHLSSAKTEIAAELTKLGLPIPTEGLNPVD